MGKNGIYFAARGVVEVRIEYCRRIFIIIELKNSLHICFESQDFHSLFNVNCDRQQTVP